ncbi:Peptidylamidoglycolate lyase [Aphelenchoides bicaudatus]|nr:Peptidylamidoglycolate lyase [Aphelenchoides bicaudatus]
MGLKSMIPLICLCLIGATQAELFYGLPNEQQPAEEFYNGFQEPAPIIDVDEAQLPEQIEQAEQPEQESVESPKIPLNIGHATGVAVNKDGQLVVFHRAGRVWDEFSFNEKTNVFNKSLDALHNATITVLDPTSGQILGEFGQGLFYMPHGMSIDASGNYWVTDVGRHQVFKLNSEFKPLLVLGEKMVPGSDEHHFCKPTDVAVSSKTGEIFVADGYCNSRIMKFSADGKFLGSFGNMNTDQEKPANGEFFVPHSIALIEDLNLLCVADRENQRIQCFTAGLSPKGAHQRAITPTGSFVTKAQNIGRIMAIREKQHYLVGVTNTEPNTSNDYELFIMDMNSGKANTFAKGIPDAHAVALSKDGSIYVAQLDPSQVLKFSVPQTDDQSMQ